MTTADFVLPGLLSVLAVVVIVGAAIVVGALRAQARRAEVELAATRAESAELRARLDALSVALTRASPTSAAEPDRAGYLITAVGESDPSVSLDQGPVQVQRIEGRLFADIVLRETVVKAGAFGHGVRRALAPETRNRIRFEMRREMKRLRKERKVTERDVRREAASRQRVRIADDEARQRRTA